jgi:hypothetical protein
VKFVKLVWQNVSIRYEVKGCSSKFLLSLAVVEAKTVFSCDLVGHREVVDALKFVKAFVEEGLAAGARPKDVPLVRLRVVELVGFK